MSSRDRDRGCSHLTALLAEAEAARNEAVAFLQELIRIPSINHGSRADTGGETKVCECIGDKLTADGLRVEILESASGRGNLIARVGDAGAERRLLLLSHTDVVPVEDESTWVHAPFSGAVVDGCVHGRGADDDKGDVVAHVMALLVLERAGVRLGGELICLAAADEESGGRWGAGWIVDNAPDKVRADHAINEGSGIPVHHAGGLAYPICNGEKGRYELHLKFPGVSGHAARPWNAKNPLIAAAEAVRRIAEYEPDLDFSHPCYTALGRLLGLPGGADASAIDQLPAILPGSDALACTMKAASRMTITPTMIHAGIKSNSIPASAPLACDIRTLPGQDAEYVAGELTRILGELEVARELACTAASSASPVESPFVRSCHGALELALGQPVQLLPMLTTGFTDSRFVRQLGVQTYGFCPYAPSVRTERTGIHGANEYIEIDTLMLRVKTMLALACLSLGLT